MDLIKAQRMAKRTMLKHGLVDWDFEWDSHYNRYGVCFDDLQILSFSAPLAAFQDETVFRNTVLHEIAHALVGGDEGHGPVWKAKCLEIGGDGLTNGPDDESFRMATAKWVIYCSVTGDKQGYAYRRYNNLCLCHGRGLVYGVNKDLTPLPQVV